METRREFMAWVLESPLGERDKINAAQIVTCVAKSHLGDVIRRIKELVETKRLLDCLSNSLEAVAKKCAAAALTENIHWADDA